MDLIIKPGETIPYEGAYDRKTKCGNVFISFKTFTFEFVCILCHEDCNYSTFYELFEHVTKEHTSGSDCGDPEIRDDNDDPQPEMVIEDPLEQNVFYMDFDEIEFEEEFQTDLSIIPEEDYESSDVINIGTVVPFVEEDIVVETVQQENGISIGTVIPYAEEEIVIDTVQQESPKCYPKRKNIHCKIRECKERDPTRRRHIMKLIDMYRKCVGLWHTKTASRTSNVLKTAVRRLLAEKYEPPCSIPKIRHILLRMTMCFNAAWKGNARKNYRPWYYKEIEFLKFVDVDEIPDKEFGDFRCPFCTKEVVIASGSMELWNHIIEQHKNVGNLTESESNIFLWPTEHILGFISMYREQECLWNSKCREYYDRALKDKAYVEIMENFNEIRPNAFKNREVIVETIRYLRIYFRRIGKKSQASNLLEVNTAEEPENDKIYEELLFLKNVYMPNQTHFNETFSCDLCEKTFVKKYLFMDHFKFWHKDSAFKCDKCPMVFASSDNLVSHRNTHEQGDGNTYTCPVCRLDYANSNDLEAHLLNHVPNRLHDQNCEICGAKFKDRNNLIIHLKRHSNIKNYPCEICQKRFVTSTELKLHAFMHTDERAFVCEVCGAEFKYRHHLVNHHRIHEEPRFQCKDCERKFLTKIHLVEHEKVHQYPGVPLESIPCDLCFRQFSNPGSLARHKARVHNIRRREVGDK